MLRKLLILLLLCGPVVAGAQNTPAPVTKTDYKKPGAIMPPLHLTVPDLKKPIKDAANPNVVKYEEKLYTNKDLKSKANTFVILFNPTCDHCEEETRMLIQNKDLFKKTKVVLVASPDNAMNLEFFNSGTHVADHKDVFIMGVGNADFIENLFLYEKIPQINIYDKDQRLLKVFTNETPIEELKPYIQ